MRDAPFYTGQKVIALQGISALHVLSASLIKGQVYTVNKCTVFCCGTWCVDVEIKIINGDGEDCSRCYKNHDTEIYWISHYLFAPLQHDTELSSITIEELIEEPVTF